MAGVHRLHRRADATLQLDDHLLDFLGGLLGTLGQGAHLVRHHGEAAPLLAGARRFDGGVQGQQVGLLGNALDHFQHAADGGAVRRQLVDHAHRLIDFAGQLLDAAQLRFHQRTAADGFLVDALRAVHRLGGAARHFLRGGGHLVHRRGHLFDLAALPGHRLVAFAGNLLHAAGLAFHFGHGMAHQLDQVMDLRHGAVEHLAQLAQFVAAFGAEADGHVTGRDLVHHLAQALQRGAGGDVETAVEVEDGEEHHQQRDNQQHGLHALVGEAAFQLGLEEGQGAVVELIGLLQRSADLVVELLPGRAEGVGHDHLLFEQRGALFEGVAAGRSQAVQSLVATRTALQGIGDLQAVLGVELVQIQQQVVQLGAGGRVEEALAKGIGAYGAALAEGPGHLRRGGGDQLGDLPHVGLLVLAEARLDRDELDEDLGIAQQLLDHRALALQRGFHLGRLQGTEQFVALAVEGLDLRGFGSHRRQPLEGR
ncbi:hypothetical protein D9M70_360730 [compost metagenome]